MSLFPFLRSHLLVISSLSFIAGILCSHLLAISTIWYLPFFIISSLLLIAIFTRKEILSLCFLTIFFLQIGIISDTTNRLRPPSPDILQTLDLQEDVIVLGTVQRIFGFNGETCRFDVNVHALRTEKTSFIDTHGTIRYTLKERFPQSILPGTGVAIRAKLKPPRRYLTPGSFDYPEYLQHQKIWYTGYITTPLYMQPVAFEHFTQYSFRYFIEDTREKINRFIDARLSYRQASVYKALLTGDKSSVPPEILEQFIGSGVMHILAISGIHMALLGFFLFSFFFWLLRRSETLILTCNIKKTAALLTIPPLLFYTALAGAHTPVLRSFIMSLTVIIAIYSGRIHSISTIIAVAAMVILLLSPDDLFTPSFQLSFAAVISIACAAPTLLHIAETCTAQLARKNVKKAMHWFITALGVSVAATVGTAPLVIYYFNRISLVGVVTNIIIEPLLCLWSLTFGFVAVVSLFIFHPLADFLFQIGGFGLSLALQLVHYFNSFEYSSIRLPTPPLSLIITYYISIFILYFRNTFTKAITGFTATIFLAATILIMYPFSEITKAFTSASTIAILDVGHGSATFIEFPGGKRILVDGGAISSPQYNIGERVIAPFLWNRGITTIDEVVITHPDSDHYNGIPFILQHFGVKKLWVNDRKGNSRSWQDMLSYAADNSISVDMPQSDSTIYCARSSCLEVITNLAKNTYGAISNENGLVLKFHDENFSAIFPGDITKKNEMELIGRTHSLQATLLLAAHHGSATSNSEAFLKTVSPQYLIISNNSYKTGTFPAATLSQQCERLGIKMLQTAKHGTISIVSDGSKFTLAGYLSTDTDLSSSPQDSITLQ